MTDDVLFRRPQRSELERACGWASRRLLAALKSADFGPRGRTPDLWHSISFEQFSQQRWLSLPTARVLVALI